MQALFRYASPGGVVSLRGFHEGGGRTWRIEPVVLGEAVVPGEVGLDGLVDAATRMAGSAARTPEPVVFAPPVATFRHADGAEMWRARARDLHEGLALSVECDVAPAAAQARLEALIGPATLVVASGGAARFPETGAVEPRLHLHWRLTEPAAEATAHDALRQARQHATALVGGDASNVPVVHPIRWPGSWHRKAEPRLARIVASNDSAEIDLDETLGRLEDAMQAAPRQPQRRGPAFSGFPIDTAPDRRAGDDLDVCAALAAIPNPDLDWEAWNRIGMAAWAATAGSAAGLAAFQAWSARSAKHDAAATEARWRHYATSPPERIGAGTLFHLAAEACPGWHRPSLAARTAPERVAAEAGASEDEAPVDLWASFMPPDLPEGLLPAPVETFARLQGRRMGADPAGLAMAALTVCAAALPDAIRLRVKRHDESWRESARLWTALVGQPSTRKSPIIRQAEAPLVRIDRRLHAAWRQAQDCHESLRPEERKRTPAPRHRRKRLEDTTIEAAQEVLADSPDGRLCSQDELSGWFGAMDKYSGGRGAAKDRGFWLQAWNGGPYTINRVARGASWIDNLSVSILGGIQPEPARRIAADSVDDGLIQRLCPIVLRPASLGEDAPDADGVVSAWERLVERLAEMQPPAIGSGSFDPGPAPLRFDDDAQAIRREMEVRHLALAGCEAVNPRLGAHIGKYDGLFARLCLTWHCIEHAGTDTLPAVVSAGTARRVAAFMHRFLLPHAVAFHAGLLGLSGDHDRLTAVAGYILAKGLQTVSNRDIQRGDRTMRGMTEPETRRILEQLEAFGWLDRLPPARFGAPPVWQVRAQVHERFGDRAAEETRRRDAARRAIRAIMQPQV